MTGVHLMPTDKQSLQSGFAWHCYGCGRCSPTGLHAETVKTDEGYVCEWPTQADHVAHPGKYHHGVITTICFCHGAWAATAQCHEVEGRVLAEPLDYFFVNQSISYEILRPIPLNAVAIILAKVSLASNTQAKVDFEVRVDDAVCAVASTRLQRVDAGQMEF